MLLHGRSIPEADAAALDAQAAEATLEERRSGVRSAASRMPALSAGSGKVPRVELAPLVDVSTPRLTGLGPLGQEQTLFVEGWGRVDGVWTEDPEIWSRVLADLKFALVQCPEECSQTFAGRLVEMVDEVCWRQDDFELVLDKQNSMASVIHANLGAYSMKRSPYKSKDEQLQEWAKEFNSLPVWMGLRKTSDRTRRMDSASPGFPAKLAMKEHALQEETHAWVPPPTCPRSPFPGEIFYLVLFSGHRREGDIKEISLESGSQNELGPQNLMSSRLHVSWPLATINAGTHRNTLLLAPWLDTPNQDVESVPTLCPRKLVKTLCN